MVYKVEYDCWRNSLEVGDVVEDVNEVSIKVLSIIKVEKINGDVVAFVTGVETKLLNL